MIFESWFYLLRILLVGVVAYIEVVVLIRISGKRILAQLNAFDYVITVAIGSTLAAVIVSRDVMLVEGLAALGLLILLQVIVALLSVHVKSFGRLIKSEPQLLFYRGDFLPDPMKKERIREEEILQAIRSQGIFSLEDVEAVVLETNGNFSILRKGEDHDETKTALVNVNKPARQAEQ